MDSTWILSANAGRAKVFAWENRAAPLAEMVDMVNEGARQRTAETETDDLGQRSASKSRHSVGAPTQPSGYEPNQTPAQHQTEIFARDIANYLSKAHQQQRFRQLGLIASPASLGELRKQLDKTLAAQVSIEINRDYTQLTAQELREQIEMLRP